ncbi:MAG: autotransporter domain-containing protein [Phascolarctobacterium sp.]|nr:autotransporter domain-containing protein [Phascolarctobacterium sp.]
MSKKILKRSLALGALMAFVITGSAMAAGEDFRNDYPTKYTGDVMSETPYVTSGGATIIEVIHKDEFKSWDDFKNNSNPLNNFEGSYYPGTEKLEQDITLTSNVGFVGYNDSSSNPSYNNTDLNGNKLVIDYTGVHYALESSGKYSNFSKEFYENMGYNGYVYKHIYEGLNAVVLDLPGFNIFDSKGGGDLEINSSNVAILGYGKIDVDELKITSDGNAIQSELEGASPEIGHKMEIYANSMEINTKGNAIQVYNDLDIGSADKCVGNLVIKVIEEDGVAGTYARAMRVTGGAALNIYADALNISGATGSSKVSDNGALTLSANSGNVVNDFEAASTGTINVSFGSGVNWTGKYITDTNATKGALDLSGTWNLTEASSLTNATFNAGSTLVIEGKTFDVNEDSTVYALNGAGDKAILTVENGAKLNVTGIKETTYNVATGFAEIKGENYWTVGNMADLNNNLMEGKWLQDEDKNLQLQIVAKEADTLATEMGVSQSTGETINQLIKDANKSGVDENESTPEGKLVGLANAMAKSDNPVVAGKAMEAVQKMAEAGGNSATAAKVVTNVTGVTNQRLSFSGGNAGGNKGGHGVGLLEEGSGAAVWAQYVHGKDSVEDMPSTAGASSYEGQYNGIVMGVDFKKVGKFQSGIAFNYGEGDTNSVGTSSPTRSDYDFWGVGYYGNIRNADSNVIFDIGYAKTDSDVTSDVLGQTFEASPETTTWTAGVKVEKLYQNNNVQIVPYTGLRYMSIDADDYTTKCGATSYNMQRQDIWMLPVGVSIKQEIVNKNGWVVTPKVDLSYIWAFGDTDSEMEFATAFDSKTNIGYDVMDDGSWMGLVGVEAAMDDWTFGVSYSYQKGDHSESKKWYVDAKYSF